MRKKGSGVGDKKARNEMQTSQCYKSLWLRWTEKGQAGTHGKDASSFDLRSERISHCGQISVLRLKKNIRISNCDSEIAVRYSNMALHFHIRKPHAYIVVVVVKFTYLAVDRVYTLIQRIIGL